MTAVARSALRPPDWAGQQCYVALSWGQGSDASDVTGVTGMTGAAGGAGVMDSFLGLWQAWREDPHAPHSLVCIQILSLAQAQAQAQAQALAAENLVGEGPSTVRHNAVHQAKNASVQSEFQHSTQHLPQQTLQQAPQPRPRYTLRQALLEAWPVPVEGLHALHFDAQRVQLLLAIGDDLRALRSLRAQVHAFHLGDLRDRGERGALGVAAAPALCTQPDAGLIMDRHAAKALARLASPAAQVRARSATPAARAHLHSVGFLNTATSAGAEGGDGADADADADGAGGPGDPGGAGPLYQAQFRAHWLAARRAAVNTTRNPAPASQAFQNSERHALIIGAGLAGASVAAALAAQGWRCTVLEALAEPAGAASGNPAGLVHGTAHARDGAHARFSRACALFAEQRYRPWLAHRDKTAPSAGELNGLLRVADHGATLQTAWPAAYLQMLSAAQAAQKVQTLQTAKVGPSAPSGQPAHAQPPAGAPPPSSTLGPPDAAPASVVVWPQGRGAWFFPGGGWVAPREWVLHCLAQPGVEFWGQSPVQALRYQTGTLGPLGPLVPPLWQALDAQGRCLAQAPVLVLCGGAAEALAARISDPLACAQAAQRGQISWFLPDRAAQASALQSDAAAAAHAAHAAKDATAAKAPVAVTAPAAAAAATQPPPLLPLPLAGQGYALSLPDGRLLCGASSAWNDADPQLRETDHAFNLQRLQGLTGLTVSPPTPVGGRVGWRAVTADRLPLVGALPLPAAQSRPNARLDQLRWVPRLPQAYILGGLASRGLTWAPLAAAVLTAQITGSPLPLEAELVDAIDPARGLVRAHNRPQNLPNDLLNDLLNDRPNDHPNGP